MVQWIEAGERARRIAFGMLAVLFGVLLVYGWATLWLPWSDECDQTASCHLLIGETLAAIQQAWGNLYDGLGKSWLLLRNGPDLYIHNQNLGAYLIVLTALLGADTLAPAGVITAAGFVIGLGYAYLLVERTSQSRLLALTFLGFFILHVYLNTMLGLNLLRAWHWLPLFGVAYHALDLFEARRVGPRQVAPLILLPTIGFAIGYEFYAFVIATAGLALVVMGCLWPLRRMVIQRAVMLGGLCVVPVVVRQLQVIGGVGVDIWAKDLYYTAALKSPLLRTLAEVRGLRRIMQVPPVDVIQDWYKDHSLFHGVSNQEPASAAYQLFFQNGYHLRWQQDLGTLTIATMAVGFMLAPLLLLVRRPRDVAWYARPVVIVTAGQILGFLAFGYHALLYFIVQFTMPLVISAVCLAVAFVVTALVTTRRPLAVRLFGLVLLVGLLVERASIEWWHLSTMGLRAHPPDARWSRYSYLETGSLWGYTVGWVVLILATLVGAWLLWQIARAFLHAGTTWRPEPALAQPVHQPDAPAAPVPQPGGQRRVPEARPSPAGLGSDRS